MEWSMLLVAAVIAAAAVFSAHALRRHPDSSTVLMRGRRVAERQAPHDAGADVGADGGPPVGHQRPD